MGAYALAVLIVFCVGGHSLAAHLHSRWLAGRAAYATVYVAVMALTAVLGFTLFDARRLLPGGPAAVLLAVVAGVVAGALAARWDGAILRHLRREALAGGARGVTLAGRGGMEGRRIGRLKRIPVVGPGARRRQLAGSPPTPDPWRPGGGRRFSLGHFVAIAVLEELIYRGFLVELSLMLPGPLTIGAALTTSVLFFGLAHLVFGWPHVLAKLPLGVLTLALVLLLGGLLGAIVAHVVFNVRIWRDWSKRPRFASAT